MLHVIVHNNTNLRIAVVEVAVAIAILINNSYGLAISLVIACYSNGNLISARILPSSPS